jgi:hypothetical protein
MKSKLFKTQTLLSDLHPIKTSYSILLTGIACANHVSIKCFTSQTLVDIYPIMDLCEKYEQVTT